MNDFLNGEHVWCKFLMGGSELRWPCIVNEVNEDGIVEVEILGTEKTMRTRINWIEHGFMYQSDNVINDARLLNLSKDQMELLYNGIKLYKQEDILLPLEISPSLYDKWLYKTITLLN